MQELKYLTFESVPENTIIKKMTVYHKSLSISMYNTTVHKNHMKKRKGNHTLVLNIFYLEERHTKSCIKTDNTYLFYWGIYDSGNLHS